MLSTCREDIVERLEQDLHQSLEFDLKYLLSRASFLLSALIKYENYVSCSQFNILDQRPFSQSSWSSKSIRRGKMINSLEKNRNNFASLFWLNYINVAIFLLSLRFSFFLLIMHMVSSSRHIHCMIHVDV